MIRVRAGLELVMKHLQQLEAVLSIFHVKLVLVEAILSIFPLSMVTQIKLHDRKCGNGLNVLGLVEEMMYGCYWLISMRYWEIMRKLEEEKDQQSLFRTSETWLGIIVYWM